MKTRRHESYSARGALGQVHSILATSFQSVSSDFCGYSQRTAKRQGKQAQCPFHVDHNKASAQALEEPSCNVTQPSADARRSHGLPQVLSEVHGDSSSQGIWKHLKLPTRWPGALTARSHTGWSTAQTLPGNQQVPYGCRWPIGSLAGTWFKSMGLTNAKRISTTTSTFPI